ncbi:hypothetical protein RvY_04275 [Ramazzottius varieornatus]|uniref:Uncharacterized protein n=1 Tax=Ramazzottius varieornatus TaxID=947166 RepID=A0A1D1V143_RAMVA|nr:hypothetical protein RvY_04275 [Ramazzottius varieornatus]
MPILILNLSNGRRRVRVPHTLTVTSVREVQKTSQYVASETIYVAGLTVGVDKTDSHQVNAAWVN